MTAENLASLYTSSKSGPVWVTALDPKKKGISNFRCQMNVCLRLTHDYINDEECDKFLRVMRIDNHGIERFFYVIRYVNQTVLGKRVHFCLPFDIENQSTLDGNSASLYGIFNDNELRDIFTDCDILAGRGINDFHNLFSCFIKEISQTSQQKLYWSFDHIISLYDELLHYFERAQAIGSIITSDPIVYRKRRVSKQLSIN